MNLVIDDKRAGILAAEGHLLIEGGPGCGKTTIALRKALQLVEQLDAEQSLLFLSFSRAAIRQITDRMQNIFDMRSRKRIEIRTFHAFFLDLVRAHSPRVTGCVAQFLTPDEEARYKFDFEGEWEPHTYDLANAGIFVFDRLADAAASMLEVSTDLRNLYADTYPVVIVDEFQDTNVDQWRAIRALASAGARVIGLADPDQRIFDEFVKGVDEHRLSELRQALKPKEFDLTGDNHRSPASGLLEYANAVLVADESAAIPDEVSLLPYDYGTQTIAAGHFALVRLLADLRKELGRPPSVAVLATENGILGQLSEHLRAPFFLASGRQVPAVDHEFLFEPGQSAAAGYVVASIMEWPGLSRAVAISQTIAAQIDFYRTVGGVTARKKANILARGLKALSSGATIRSKDVKLLLEAYDAGVYMSGAPVSDWQAARAVLTGSADLRAIFNRARHLRLLRATDDLAWGLSEVWDGIGAYQGAESRVRDILAARLLDDSRTPPTDVVLMNMHKSKGKEFDGVVILEGLFSARLLSRVGDFAPRSPRRRLLRVALTRARYRVLLVRPSAALSLMTKEAPADLVELEVDNA